MKIHSLLLIIILISFSTKVYSATCTAQASSNWSLSSTWSCGTVPTCNDVIVIPSGYTVTINQSINLDAAGCLTRLNIYGVLFFSGNASSLQVSVTSTINIYSGGKLTTDQNNNSQKIRIGNGSAEWDSNDGNISGPWTIKNNSSASNASLPIELLDFSSTCITNGVLLNWSTASEIENDYFLIERSSDGINWNSIGKVDGNGTTTDVHKYVHEDVVVTDKVLYYRLVQFDFDGKSTTHKIIDANCGAKSKDELLLYPNPSSTELNALFTMNKAVTGAEIKIMNMSGQIVLDTKIDLQEGLNSFTFPIDFNSGSYQVIVSTGDIFIPSQKILVVKP